MAKSEYKYFRLIKTWDDRIKAKSDTIQEQAEQAYIFQMLLNKRPEISEVVMKVNKGEIDIKFDAGAMPKESLLSAMDVILENIAKKSLATIPKLIVDQPKQTELMVAGMSCPACALLIEMTLKRDPQIVDVCADQHGKKVTVYGAMPKESIIRIIENLGYSHIKSTS